MYAMSETFSLLLIDDEEGIRKVLGLSLTDAGWRVRTASSAEEALAVFRQENFPIVLTDIKMPGMDGLELLKALKECKPETEVVLMTGHGDLGLAIQGIKLDAADFVTKPIHDDALDIALARARERWSMRQAIRKHTEHLQELVEQKTRELLAAERLATIGQTVAGLSHSIKNMASGLEGSLFLLRQGLDTDHRDYLEQGWEMLEVNVRKLKNLSLDMLRFARIETLHPKPTDPAKPARQVVELFQARAREQGLALTLHDESDLPMADLDAEAVHRCLMDLVGNALDACLAAGFGPRHPGGQVILSVNASPDRIIYRVSDNGCGIAEDTMSKLFSTFFSTKGEHGSGLGLMAVKKTVQAHGGNIDVRSTHKAGSEFIISIPFKCENKNA
jgi:signal transduction histidine kinase